MNSKELALDCKGCDNWHECKTHFKACELYHNKIEGMSVEGAETRPEYVYFDLCEDGYKDTPTTYVKTYHSGNWDVARVLYESSIGDVLPEEFKDEVDKWLWVVAYKNNMPVGGIAWEADKHFIINFLYVRHSYQGQGIGSSLISMAIPDEAGVLVMPDHNSEDFYRANGFEKKGPLYTRNIE